ncbi:MAG: SDR family oxidoreductase [Bacteroidota bacterium]
MHNFSGKTALITGAANGIGKALAKVLAREHCNLVLLDIDAKGLNNLKTDLSDLSIQVTVKEVDISNWDAVNNAGNAVAEMHSNIHYLINSVGVSIKSSISDQSPEDIQWITGINYIGTIYICKRFLDLMDKNQPGAIVNIASGAGIQGFSGRTTYCGSKFGIKGFTEALKAELYKSKIDVSCVFPGPVATKMYKGSRYADESERKKEEAYLTNQGYTPEYVADAILKGISRRKANILIGKEIFFLFHLKRLFPKLFPRYLYRNQDKLPG